MATPEKNSPSILPKISRKLAYRTLVLVVVVGSLVYGMEWFLQHRSDLGQFRESNTVNWISAVQYLPDGYQQAVLIEPGGGKIHKDPGYVAKTNDRDVTWSPHGNFLYFASDRTDHNFNIFRWSPSSDDPAEQRTIGTRARGNLKFSVQADEKDGEAKGLLTTGGLVQEFDPNNSTTAQVLPPSQKEISQSKGDESGTESQFEGIYGTFGTSFREAQWCGGHRYIAGIMEREAGESLILQDTQPVDGKLVEPRQLLTGEKIEIAINPKDGNIVYCLQGFQWPSGVPPTDKDGKVIKKPFLNAIGVLSPTAKPITLSGNNGQAIFSSPSVSYDGKAIAVIVSTVEKGEVKTFGLVTFPTSNDPGFKQLTKRGEIHEPSWSPDGLHIVASVKLPGKHYSIYAIPVDESSAPLNLTGDVGDFRFPKYSPQVKN